MRVCGCKGVSKGRAEGPVFIARRSCMPSGNGDVASNSESCDPQAEKRTFEEAAKAVADELHGLSVKSGIDVTSAGLFSAHEEMARDPALHDSVCAYIDGKRLRAEEAVSGACADFCARLEALDDPYMSGRSADVTDVCNRIRERITGRGAGVFGALKEPSIVMAKEFFPSDFAKMDFSFVRGLVSCRGGYTSHASIMARSRHIPAAVGLSPEDLDKISNGDTVFLDGGSGEVAICPDETAKAALEAVPSHAVGDENSGYDDGFVNAGSVEDVERAISEGAEGIGLFRTEFIFLHSEGGFPSEDNQVSVYSRAAKACCGKPLVIRTLDIGGDKQLPYFKLPAEPNPFLGMRGIRLSLGSMSDCFKTQVRAIIRAYSSFPNIAVMFPMIVSTKEFEAAKATLSGCVEDLSGEGLEFVSKEPISTGCMIETPAAVLLADELASEADFFSVGTNDLTQYLQAADRGNPEMDGIYSSGTEALKRALDMIFKAASDHGIRCRICGEIKPE